MAPTPFDEDGVDDVCVLANFSEQFLLGDDERAGLTRLCLERVAGRRQVIVTISHFSTAIVAAWARKAAARGAALRMMMPPYDGAGLSAEEAAVFEHVQRAARRVASRSWSRARRCQA